MTTADKLRSIDRRASKAIQIATETYLSGVVDRAAAKRRADGSIIKTSNNQVGLAAAKVAGPAYFDQARVSVAPSLSGAESRVELPSKSGFSPDVQRTGVLAPDPHIIEETVVAFRRAFRRM